MEKDVEQIKKIMGRIWGDGEISRRLKGEAVKLGLCEKWTDEWQDVTDRDELVRKFVRGIDFCIEHDWPSVDVMKRYFGDMMCRHGVYADENVTAYDAPVVVLNGECVGDIEYGGTSAGEVYVRHSSEATVCARGAARVFVNVYDEGELLVSCDEGAKCFVYLYGGSMKRMRDGGGEVVVRDKRKTKVEKEGR